MVSLPKKIPAVGTCIILPMPITLFAVGPIESAGICSRMPGTTQSSQWNLAYQCSDIYERLCYYSTRQERTFSCLQLLSIVHNIQFLSTPCNYGKITSIRPSLYTYFLLNHHASTMSNYLSPTYRLAHRQLPDIGALSWNN